MTEALARKKKTRAAHRSSATRIMNQLAEESASKDGPTLERLLQCKLSLKEKLETLKALDEEIISLVDEDALDDQIEQADVFKERVQQSVFIAERLITSKTSTAPRTRTSVRSELTSDAPPPSTSLSSVHSDSPVVTSSPTVKLPKLMPKKFNGDLTKWETFWSSFESTIHLNTTLSGVDKFNYLSSLLEGPALAAVAGLKITTANYTEAIDTLKKRFGNKQQIISRHMDTLLELEPVTSPTNIKALRRLYDQTEFQVRSLKSLEVPLNSYGNLLSSLFMNRLPQELRLIVSREVGEAEWRIDQIMTIIEREISARERAFTPSNSQLRGSGLPTATALVTSDGQPKCSYCRQGHPSVSCTTVTDLGQRKAILKRTGRCFVCLKRHHLSRDCRSPIRCARCKGRHHTSICKEGHTNFQSTRSNVNTNQEPRRQQNQELPPPQNHEPPSPQNHTSATTQLYCVNTALPVLLQTAKAYVHKPGDPSQGMTIRVMLDGGSQRSYVTQRVRETLGLEPESVEEMQIRTFGSESTTLQTVEMATIAVSLKTGDPIHVLFSTVPFICEPLSCQPIAYTKERYRHLANLDLADFSRVGDELQIDALIGSDHYWQLVTGKVIQGESGPTAIETHLGWVLSGPVSNTTEQNKPTRPPTSHAMHVSTTHLSDSPPHLSNLLKAFWELESLGIKQEEPSVYDNFKKTVMFKNGRYEVNLPWKSTQTRLPSNRALAGRRLNGLLKRLRHHPKVLQEYHAVMQEQLRQGIIEKVDETQQTTGRIVHYLPHHAVIRQDKETTKLRIVYDASARGEGPSLNDCLYSGPKFDQNILDIVLRFRAYKVAVVADVEKAFLMVSVSEEDRDALRFLWVEDIEKTPLAPVPMRFTRVVFGVSASPFLLNATINHHLKKYQNRYPDLVNTLMRSIYVDDVTYGAEGENEAYQLYTLSKGIFAEGGFNLRKFVTSSPSLRQRIAADEHRSEKKHAVFDTNSNVVEDDMTYTSGLLKGSVPGDQKVLGVSWNSVSDVLEFDIRGVAQSLQTLEPTKRNIIGFASKFYDPLGFLSPVIITLKTFFQELCKSKLDWDDPLPSELLCKWKRVVAKFHGTVISMPRCYFHSSESSRKCVLYGFCDASTAAYAAVVYLCVGSDQAQFVASKTRVAPLSQQTIPRLELLSCLLLARLITNVLAALESVIEVRLGSCFTDSKVALFWIQGEDKEWKPFVHNRVKEIRGLVSAKHWSHCPGKNNPADIPSHGVSPQELEMSLLWRHGPDWLPQIILEEKGKEVTMPEECAVEMVKNQHLTHTLLSSTKSNGIGDVIDCTRFSKLQKLLRVTVYVKKFVLTFKSLIRVDSISIDWTVTAEDIEEAEMDWVTNCQMHMTPEVQQHLAGLKVKWIFNLEKAPWWGGFFERLIQSVKRCLKKTIGKAKLTYDELLTVLTEVEAIINSRPLSYVSSEDLDEPLTPSHLLSGRRILSLPDSTVATGYDSDEDFQVTSQDVHARMCNLNKILDQFWIRWRDEYLLQLRERYHATDNTGVARVPIPGELVLVHDENHPRTMWRLGRVCELIVGSDGQTRGATLEVSTNGKLSTLRRPISRLYPLEVEPKSNLDSEMSTAEGDESNQDRQMTTQSESPTSKERPARAAAVRARQQVRDWMSELTDTV